jgi:hypothetical protein
MDTEPFFMKLCFVCYRALSSAFLELNPFFYHRYEYQLPTYRMYFMRIFIFFFWKDRN